MNIREAVIRAQNEGKYIYRESDMEHSPTINILPTNTIDCCLLVDDESNEVGKRWNPTANDLIAIDWEVR
ncbi:DUF2829 domain-containing protein [Listeria monocytogenes]|nr:DUF2829 domain-containing protein [Listeria monocytogenes]